MRKILKRVSETEKYTLKLTIIHTLSRFGFNISILEIICLEITQAFIRLKKSPIFCMPPLVFLTSHVMQ